MIPARDPKQLSLGARWEEASGGGIMEEASGGGIIGGGIIDILEASLGTWETPGGHLEVSARHLGRIWESFGVIWRHLGTSESQKSL